MRIVFLNRRFCPGEAWTNRILAYARGLSEQQIEVELLYLIPDKNRTPYHIDIPGVTVVNLFEKDGWLAKRNRYISLLINFIRAIWFLRKRECAFVYADGSEKWLLRMAFFSRVKVFTEITEHPFLTHHLYKKDREYVNHDLPRKYMARLKKASAVFVISEPLRKLFIENGLDKDKVHVVNMFVDTSRFDNLQKKPTEKYIAYCGTVSSYKDGVDLLIRAFSIFCKHHDDYKLYIIGPYYSTQVALMFQQLVQQLNIEGRVVFTGKVPYERIPQLLVDAEMLALARPDNLQARYGFPTKLGEYLATGNPVVVTAVGDIPRFIEDGKNGFLAAPDDIIGFAEKMLWVAEHPQEATTAGNNGRLLCQKEFSYKAQSQVLFDVIQKVTTDR